ncbi:MAG: polysaccharide deacetylase family protein [Candidatus Acidiferrales bacterium]
MDIALANYFRCPERFAGLGVGADRSSEIGFFQFGDGITCYGRCVGGTPSRDAASQHLTNTLHAIRFEQEQLRLPFDFTEVVDNLRHERYPSNPGPTLDGFMNNSATRWAYYLLRPSLPVPVRKHLQRARLSGWKKITFPHWPVDFTVDSLMERVLALVLKSQGMTSAPFIWFWPNGAPSCAIMTHDVEGTRGRDFCGKLMDLDDSFGMKSAFQIIPGMGHVQRNGFLSNFRARGFEINVHDLNHDGFLFREKEEFLRHAKQINRYAKEFRAEGFRSGAMYRNQDWFDAFEFSYDMSVPSVAHLEPQRGGCCTVMPYFIGKILELPLTTIQDYSLFHILGDYSIDLWKQQIDLIIQKHGLVSFITHPDYLIKKRAQSVYLDLLAHLAQLRAEKKLWRSLPAEVNRWWRNRSQMSLVQDGDRWRIEGPDSERARIAYASLQGDRVAYSLDLQPQSSSK